MDSVEENIQASRRLLLLYTASTFTSKRHTSSTSSTNNNNISKNSNNSDSTESETKDSSFDGIKEDYQDTRQQLECVAAMHRALVERSLKVRKQICQCIFWFYLHKLDIELLWLFTQHQTDKVKDMKVKEVECLSAKEPIVEQLSGWQKHFKLLSYAQIKNTLILNRALLYRWFWLSWRR